MIPTGHTTTQQAHPHAHQVTRPVTNNHRTGRALKYIHSTNPVPTNPSNRAGFLNVRASDWIRTSDQDVKTLSSTTELYRSIATCRRAHTVFRTGDRVLKESKKKYIPHLRTVEKNQTRNAYLRRAPPRSKTRKQVLPYPQRDSNPCYLREREAS